jgi:hypothetical protein
VKLWQSVVFWLGVLALLIAFDMTGLTHGIPDSVIAAAIAVVLGGFIVVMGMRARK